ncbi:MAG: hypothetical protein ACRCW2_15005 [Cellulosilyticaceae bacterium]
MDKKRYQCRLLDHLIQRGIADEVNNVDEEALARAIQTLLEDEDTQNLH